MSIYYDKFGLNTYYGTPYFQAHLPQGFPVCLIMQKCRAFRRLPSNLRRLAKLSKRWKERRYPDAIKEIDNWYDPQGYELNPSTGVRLTDAEINAQWQPDSTLDGVQVQDIPIPPGGFPDPDTWEEPEKEEDPVDPDDIPSPAQLASDVASHGLARTADEYGMNADRLGAYLTLSDPLTQNAITRDEAKAQFSERAALMLASPYFRGRNQERAFMREALKGADIYDELRGPAKLSFDLAEVHGLRFSVQEPAAETAKPLVKTKEPRKQSEGAKSQRDKRLPKVGTILEREYKGKTYKIEILANGFRLGKKLYTSLSAVAKAVRGTDTEVNGFAFFGLTEQAAPADEAPSPDMPTFAHTSVYTILHSNDLDRMVREGRCGTFTERKKWVTADRLWRAARANEQILPVIFAPGEHIRELTHIAEVAGLEIKQDESGKWSTAVSIVNLRKIAPPRPQKTQLRVCSTGEPLPENHIRPYVLVETPAFLTQKKNKRK